MTEGTTTRTGSTVPRRQLGRQLRELRSRSRLNIRTAAAELEYSEAKIWRIESGLTSLRSFDVETMCKVYGASADLTEGRQLQRLVEAGGLATVSIRVVPFAAGLHRGVMSGPFVILRFPLNANGEETEPAIVYVDGLTGALYLDKPHEIDRYDTASTNIWESSLDEKASQELITQVIRERGT